MTHTYACYLHIVLYALVCGSLPVSAYVEITPYETSCTVSRTFPGRLPEGRLATVNIHDQATTPIDPSMPNGVGKVGVSPFDISAGFYRGVTDDTCVSMQGSIGGHRLNINPWGMPLLSQIHAIMTYQPLQPSKTYVSASTGFTYASHDVITSRSRATATGAADTRIQRDPFICSHIPIWQIGTAVTHDAYEGGGVYMHTIPYLNLQITSHVPPHTGYSIHGEIMGHVPYHERLSSYLTTGIDAHGYLPLRHDNAIIMHTHGYLGGICTNTTGNIPYTQTLHIESNNTIRRCGPVGLPQSTLKTAVANIECIVPWDEKHICRAYGFYDIDTHWDTTHFDDADAIDDTGMIGPIHTIGCGVNFGDLYLDYGYTLNPPEEASPHNLQLRLEAAF